MNESLTDLMVRGLSGIEGVHVYGPGTSNQRIGVVSFTVDGMHPHDVAHILDEASGIMVRSGEHCCIPLMRLLGTMDGTVRASLHLYNNEEDVDRLLTTVGGNFEDGLNVQNNTLYQRGLGRFYPSTHEVIEEVPLAITINGRHAPDGNGEPSHDQGVRHRPPVYRADHPWGGRDRVGPYRTRESQRADHEPVQDTRLEKDRVVGMRRVVILSRRSKITTNLLGPCPRRWLRSNPPSGRPSSPTSMLKPGGIHIIGLFNETGAIIITEDIGRHNALDRAIGYGLLNKSRVSPGRSRSVREGFHQKW